ncbi:DTW domain-containing protein [Melia azedarach]|uniref:DTW domain-containing protein n=1 Tax=Melia azedarach TaxID=155640 RepID=A0ACC1Z2H2_MELAZ|nr:DTW domain-containing protein [Melia azedarach]
MLSSAKTHMESPRRNLLMTAASRSPQREVSIEDTGDGFIKLQEWQGWASVSPLPAMVKQIVDDLKALEENIDAQMTFGGNGGQLQEVQQN